jgi:hypothetical protein
MDILIYYFSPIFTILTFMLDKSSEILSSNSQPVFQGSPPCDLSSLAQKPLSCLRPAFAQW